MKKMIAAIAALMLTAAPAMAHGGHHRGHYRGYSHSQHYNYSPYRGYYRNHSYSDRRYYDSRRGYRYYGDQRRQDRYCRRSDGTVGTVVGGVAGALAGRTIDTHGDRTTGTVLGGALGALLGNQLGRGERCR